MVFISIYFIHLPLACSMSSQHLYCPSQDHGQQHPMRRHIIHKGPVRGLPDMLCCRNHNDTNVIAERRFYVWLSLFPHLAVLLNISKTHYELMY